MIARTRLAALMIVTFFAPIASADPPAAGDPSMMAASPIVTVPAPLPFGEPTGPSSSFYWAQPIRLSLGSNYFSHASLFPNCASREEAAGNSIGGMPVQKFTLLRLSPRLVLTGFSSLGCPIDGAIGGAASYGVPLSATSHFVLGSGFYSAPALPAGLVTRAEAKTTVALRADIVWQTPKGSTRSLGIGTTAGVGGGASRNMFVFGGAF